MQSILFSTENFICQVSSVTKYYWLLNVFLFQIQIEDIGNIYEKYFGNHSSVITLCNTSTRQKGYCNRDFLGCSCMRRCGHTLPLKEIENIIVRFSFDALHSTAYIFLSPSQSKTFHVFGHIWNSVASPLKILVGS